VRSKNTGARPSRFAGGKRRMKPVAYSVPDVLKMIGISRTTLYQLVKTGKLKVRKVGTRSVILSKDLEEWLESLPVLHDFGGEE
jgi:excisionase family DNA binding protein